MGESDQSKIRDLLKLGYGAGGIYFFWMLFGIIQEKVNTKLYGADQQGAGGEKFTYTLFLVLVQCIANCGFAICALRFSKDEQPDIPLTAFMGMSMSYIGAMFCSNAALQWINYPTQVLVKSCKMIPVMLMNMITGTKSYTWQSKARVLVLTAGICGFLLAKKSSKKSGETAAIGLLLAGASLVCDGYTGGSQDRLKKNYTPSKDQLMFYMNLWSVVLLIVACLVTWQGPSAVIFVIRHPEILLDLLLFCSASALGQNFIFYTIATFGALPCAAVTTTRKFFTILASVVINGHTLAMGQWGSMGLVFLALGWELFSKWVPEDKPATVSLPSVSEEEVEMEEQQGLTSLER